MFVWLSPWVMNVPDMRDDMDSVRADRPQVRTAPDKTIGAVQSMLGAWPDPDPGWGHIRREPWHIRAMGLEG